MRYLPILLLFLSTATAQPSSEPWNDCDVRGSECWAYATTEREVLPRVMARADSLDVLLGEVEALADSIAQANIQLEIDRAALAAERDSLETQIEEQRQTFYLTLRALRDYLAGL